MIKKLSIMLVVFVLTSCGKHEALSSNTYVLENPADGVEITLGFNVEENRYFGSVVNRYFGRYKTDGNKITIAPGGATMMMGPPDAMKAEQEFFALLPKIVSYKVKGDTLVLTTSDAQELKFVQIAK